MSKVDAVYPVAEGEEVLIPGDATQDAVYRLLIQRSVLRWVGLKLLSALRKATLSTFFSDSAQAGARGPARVPNSTMHAAARA